jgi:hypothetical protein
MNTNSPSVSDLCRSVVIANDEAFELLGSVRVDDLGAGSHGDVRRSGHLLDEESEESDMLAPSASPLTSTVT